MIKSVSRKMKALYLKDGKSYTNHKLTISLKEFARRTVLKGGENGDLAATWFDNKHGACEDVRLEKNKSRVVLEKAATKTAKRSKKGASVKVKDDTIKTKFVK